MAKLPLILVAPSIEKRGVEFHDLSVSLSVKYDFSVTQAGGIPVTLPATNDRALLTECVQRTTAIVIAHRLSTITHADRIVVINQGRIESIGRHEQLLQTSATYRRFCELQFGPAAEAINQS